jgi:hypothetical protein
MRESRTFTLSAYQFMREHAGYSYRPSMETPEQGRVNTALALARAEHVLTHSRAFVTWEDDPDGTCAGEHPAYVALLWHPNDQTNELLADDWPPRASLGGIDAGEGDPYRRVVAAELALEAGICHPMDRPVIA